MSIVQRHLLCCDYPGCTESFVLPPMGSAVATPPGWLMATNRYGNLVHLCPACAKKRRPDWWPKDTED